MKVNEENLLYFEAQTVRGLYDRMSEWQVQNQKRFLSVSVHKETCGFACLAVLADKNPMEVVITDDGGNRAEVSSMGSLITTTRC